MINYLLLKYYEWRCADWAQYEDSLRRQCALDIESARYMQKLMLQKIEQCERKRARQLIQEVCK